MLKKFTFSLVAIITLSFVVIAQDGKTSELTGNVVDNACSARVAKQSDPQVAADKHTAGCALMDACFKSGLGIYSGGKYYKFDEKGNTLAKAALEKSKGAKFKVTGTVTGDTMAVASITAVE